MDNMKRYGSIVLAFAALVVVSGCRLYHISTTIDRNGACERTIVIETEDGSISDTAYPVPDSTSWEMEVVPNLETDDEEDLIYTFRKRFRSVRAMEREFAAAEYPGPRLERHVRLEKRHRWFVTWLTFHETYEPLRLFRNIPAEDWFSGDEIDRLIADDADSTLEARAEEWEIRNYFEEVYRALRSGIEELDSPDLTLEDLEAGKERFYEVLIPAADDADDEEIAELVLETAGEVYGSTGVARLEPAMEAFESEFLRYTEFVGNLAEEGFEHIVTMPGVITASNGEEEDLNRVTWEIESSRIQYLGADLWVESRVPNRLAVWITILLAIGVLTIAIVTIVRRT